MQSVRPAHALPAAMLLRTTSHLATLLLFTIACAPAQRPPEPPADTPAATPEQPPASEQPAETPAAADATTPVPAAQTARLHHPGEPRNRNLGGPGLLSATPPAEPAKGAPASQCAGRSPGERWERPGGGTCTCRADGEVSCRRVEARGEVSDPQG